MCYGVTNEELDIINIKKPSEDKLIFIGRFLTMFDNELVYFDEMNEIKFNFSNKELINSLYCKKVKITVEVIED